MGEAPEELTDDGGGDCCDGCRHDCACLDHDGGLSIDDAGGARVESGKDAQPNCLNQMMMRGSNAGSSMSVSKESSCWSFRGFSFRPIFLDEVKHGGRGQHYTAHDNTLHGTLIGRPRRPDGKYSEKFEATQSGVRT